MSRQQRITEILAQRIPLSQKLDEASRFTQNLISELKGLDGLIEEYEILGSSSNEQSQAIAYKQINTQSIQSTLNSELENINYLHERFSKPPLKIAVAGLPKEGKSTFIRAVTGLSEKVIPSSKYLCTGSPYSIYNHENDETFAWVDFYSKNSFLQEVIFPYYDDPDLNLSDRPTSLDSWQRPELQDSDADAVKQTKYKRLLSCYEFYSKYKTYLSQPRRQVKKDEIRQYIAQVNENEEDIHIYRAVQKAEIFTKFPNSDVGQIALVDTPGLGELRSKEEEKLVETLRRSADIVISIILPRSDEFTYQARHANFFRLMQKGIGKAEKRCLLVLNVNDNVKNNEACRELSKQDKLAQWSLKFARVFVANCDQPEKVGSSVVDPTLDYLASTISSLDYDDVKTPFKVILEQSQKIDSIFKKIYVEPSENIQYVSSKEYRKIFETTFEPGLRAALKAMIKSFEKTEKTLSIQTIVQNRIESLSLSVPSAELLESRRNPKDTYDTVFEKALGELRAEALRHFQGLDLEFKPIADELRKIVGEELKKIGLEQLSSKDGNEFIDAIYHLIPETCMMLKLAFRTLREFELSYFWLIRVKIYQGINPLLPSETIFKPKSNDPSKPVTAETINLALDEICKTTKSNLLGSLGGKAADDLFPSSAVLAVLEEFIDLVFHSSDKDGRSVVSGEWQDFLEPHKTKIWREEFGKLEEDIVLRERWSKTIEQVRSCITKLNQACSL